MGSMVTRDPVLVGAIFKVLVGETKRAPETFRGPSCWLVPAKGQAFLAAWKRLSASSQLTTSHHACMYSGRLFWYFR